MTHTFSDDIDPEDLRAAFAAGPGRLWVLPELPQRGLSFDGALALCEALADWVDAFIDQLCTGDDSEATTAWARVIGLFAEVFPSPMQLAVLTGAHTELDYFGDVNGWG